MNNLFYIKDVTDVNSEYKKYFKINCPSNRYLDDISDNIQTVTLLDNNIPCYSQLYSGYLYKVDLTEANIACNPPNSPSIAATYRTYKFEIGSDTRMYITKQTQGSSNYSISLDQYNSAGDSIGSYIGYDTLYGYNNYNNVNFQEFPSPGTYYVTVRQTSTYNQFVTNEILFTFDDTSEPQISNIKKYKNLFTNNKKFYIIYNKEKLDFNYKVDYNELFDGQYEINSLIFKVPDSVPASNNTLYPIIYDENGTNVELTINENDVDNTANVGLYNGNGDMELNDFTFNLSYKNKHTSQNYKILKDLLFTVSDTTANLRCNILYDNTTLFEDVIIGNQEQFNLNLYLLASYDISKVYYELQYSDNNCSLVTDINMVYFNNPTSIPLINMKIADIIQDNNDQNCIMFDKYLNVDNDTFDILNVKQTYKKYVDLLDHDKLFKSKEVSVLKEINYLNVGYTNTVVTDHVFSEHGWYNKINDNLYSLVQFVNNDATDLLYNETIFVELYCEDGTTYSILNEVNIPINITDTTVNDAVYYGDKIQYIELLKNNIIISLFIDISNDKIYYQGNLNYVSSLTGLKYYPIKSIKDNSLYLTRVGIDEIGQDNYKIIYNYKYITDTFQSQYNENLIGDVQCPYKDIYLSDDKTFLLFEMNEDVCIYNKNNKSMIDLSSDNYYLNYNNSLNYYDGIGEVIKIDNDFIMLSTINSDNIIAENNQKLEDSVYEPIISYDYIDIEQFNSIKVLENNVPASKEVILIMTQRNNYLNNYPIDIVLYKDEQETKFSFPTNILNFDIDMINKYYKIKRFIMKNKTTQLNYIHNLNQ